MIVVQRTSTFGLASLGAGAGSGSGSLISVMISDTSSLSLRLGLLASSLSSIAIVALKWSIQAKRVDANSRSLSVGRSLRLRAMRILNKADSKSSSIVSMNLAFSLRRGPKSCIKESEKACIISLYVIFSSPTVQILRPASLRILRARATCVIFLAGSLSAHPAGLRCQLIKPIASRILSGKNPVNRYGYQTTTVSIFFLVPSEGETECSNVHL